MTCFGQKKVSRWEVPKDWKSSWMSGLALSCVSAFDDNSVTGRPTAPGEGQETRGAEQSHRGEPRLHPPTCLSRRTRDFCLNPLTWGVVWVCYTEFGGQQVIDIPMRSEIFIQYI